MRKAAGPDARNSNDEIDGDISGLLEEGDRRRQQGQENQVSLNVLKAPRFDPRTTDRIPRSSRCAEDEVLLVAPDVSAARFICSVSP
ncbi:hypothetical protein AGIG_G19046 [Arapaima gigas]